MLRAHVSIRTLGLLIALATGSGSVASSVAATTPDEQRAFQTAAARVSPSVVRIETVGGAERIGRVAVGTAATSGLIISSDGFILSSAFNFAQRPNSILVTLASGKRQAARLIATDHNRMVTLLKIDTAVELPIPEMAPESEAQIGQWAIAIGRTFDASRPNLSVGILSGRKRIWGKAFQTDAKISPANYGGPLVDIRGRVLGILVPLAPDNNSEVAGAEWYDSGIGFAIPLEHINKMLPRLKSGEDLKTGMLGIGLKGENLFGEPVIGAVRPNSPAYKAGLKAGDRIKGFDGQPIERLAQLRSQLNSRYAGEKVNLTLARGEQTIESEMELVAELQPYAHPFLGMLPARQESPAATGLEIRYVYPESPLAKVGATAGDHLISIAGQTTNTVIEAWERLAAHEPGEKIAIRLGHGAEAHDHEIELARLPEVIPTELPPAHAKREPGKAEQPPRGHIKIKVSEFANDCLAFVPESYEPGRSFGLVLWLHGPNGYQADELVKLWQPICEQFDLILVAPHAAASNWQPPEVEMIRKSLSQVANDYHVDRARIVAGGEGTGGSLAYIMAFTTRDLLRGVVGIGAPPAGKLPDNEPLQRLAIYSASSKSGRFAQQVANGVERLRELKFPVTTKDLGEQERTPTADELVEVGQWVDSLDRL